MSNVEENVVNDTEVKEEFVEEESDSYDEDIDLDDEDEEEGWFKRTVKKILRVIGTVGTSGFRSILLLMAGSGCFMYLMSSSLLFAGIFATSILAVSYIISGIGHLIYKKTEYDDEDDVDDEVSDWA